MVRVAATSGILMTVRLLVDSKNLRGSTLVTGFHGVGQTGYIATSYMIHALKAERIGFIDVSNPPPWVGTAEGGLVTPFEVYRRGKTVLVKLEFSPHRSEEAEFAKSISDWAIGQKFNVEVSDLVKDAKFIEREFDQKSRMTRKSLQRMYA